MGRPADKGLEGVFAVGLEAGVRDGYFRGDEAATVRAALDEAEPI